MDAAVCKAVSPFLVTGDYQVSVCDVLVARVDLENAVQDFDSAVVDGKLEARPSVLH